MTSIKPKHPLRMLFPNAIALAVRNPTSELVEWGEDGGGTSW